MTSKLKVHAIVLAAGESKRFMGTKQLAGLNAAFSHSKDPRAAQANEGPLLIIRAIQQVSLAQFDSITVLLGANASPILRALKDKRVLHQAPEYIVFENWHAGMGATIAHGMQSIPKDATHVCITLADQAALTGAHYDLLVAHANQHPKHIVAARFNGRMGAPSIFPASYFADLAMLKGDKGARKLIADEHHNVIAVSIPEAAIDVDTRSDLLNVNQQYKQPQS
jgi:molybdenum cofactor cytidylyltransferase